MLKYGLFVLSLVQYIGAAHRNKQAELVIALIKMVY